MIYLYSLGINDDSAIASDGEDDLTGKTSDDYRTSDSTLDLTSDSNKQVDLFSEIHLNELKKLEKQLEQVSFG